MAQWRKATWVLVIWNVLMVLWLASTLKANSVAIAKLVPLGRSQTWERRSGMTRRQPRRRRLVLRFHHHRAGLAGESPKERAPVGSSEAAPDRHGPSSRGDPSAKAVGAVAMSLSTTIYAATPTSRLRTTRGVGCSEAIHLIH